MSSAAIPMAQLQSSPYGQPSAYSYNSSGRGYPSMSMDPSSATALKAMNEGGVEQERRHVQSVILNEEYLSQQAEDTVTYVEVPYIEEKIIHVPVREVREIEKKVPKYEIEYVDRIVEIPQIQYIDKTVEVPQVHEVLRHVPKREVVEVPKEFIKHVPKIETKIVEKTVEVPGERIEVPKPYTVENKVPVAQYIDREVPMVVAQTVRPVISEAQEQYDVDVIEYEPEVIQVNIHVPKALPTHLISKGVVDEVHRVVHVPAAQYNSMLRILNPHINDKDVSALPYINQEGKVPFLGASENIPQVAPLHNAEILGWSASQAHMAQATVSREIHMGGNLSQRSGRGSHFTSSAKDLGEYGQRNSKLKRDARKGRKVRGACPC